MANVWKADTLFEMGSHAENFERQLRRSENPFGLCVVAILAWVAAADGKIDPAERESLHATVKNTPEVIELDALLDAAMAGDEFVLTIAFDGLRYSPPESRPAIMDLSVAIAIADGYMVNSEAHALFVIADILDLGYAGLAQSFSRITGSAMPEIGDPSSLDWWERKERKASGRQQRRPQDPPGDSDVPQRLKDLGVLGLDGEATIEDIRQAYRRLASVHHPDRFASMGSEAVAAAEESFRRISNAYNRLVEE